MFKGVQSFFPAHKSALLVLLLMAAFAFRLAFGLSSEFWFEDEIQIYLIGLKFYTTGHWPYFGPDIVYTGSQIPGALQGLLAGLPFFVWPVPESPFILLNLLSFSALCLFAVYLRRRFPSVPSWFTWIWLLSCPWTLNYSTHVVNPSYVLPAAVLFFIGFFESLPRLNIKFIRPILAWFLMGFSLFWIYQIHMSWILLLPFAGWAFIRGFRRGWLIVPAFLSGCLLMAAWVFPTWLAWGMNAGSTGSNIVFNPENTGEILTLISRFLSFASFELPRFIGDDTPSRLDFLTTYWPVVPFAVYAGLLGLAQPLYLAVAFFLKNPDRNFRPVKWITLGAILITWISFFFSVKGPSSHTFYLLFPLAMIYSFYCWQPLFEKRWFRIMMAVLLLSGLLTHTAIMMNNYRTKSLYLNRQKPLNAIVKKDAGILGERRPWDRNN